MTKKQITIDMPGHILLNVDEASEFFEIAFGLTYSAPILRDMARKKKLPFFKVDQTRKTAPYVIEVNDIRTHVWSLRNRARKQRDDRAVA